MYLCWVILKKDLGKFSKKGKLCWERRDKDGVGEKEREREVFFFSKGS